MAASLTAVALHWLPIASIGRCRHNNFRSANNELLGPGYFRRWPNKKKSPDDCMATTTDNGERKQKDDEDDDNGSLRSLPIRPSVCPSDGEGGGGE